MSDDIETITKEPAAVPRDLISREVARRRTFGKLDCPVGQGLGACSTPPDPLPKAEHA